MSVVDDYIVKVRKAFPVCGKDEKRFISDFRVSVEEYHNNMPNCTESLLTEKFGTPREIAVSYFSNLNENAYYLLVKKEYTTKVIFISLIITLTIMCLVFSGFCYAAFQKSSNAIGTQVKESIIEEKMDEEDNRIINNSTDGL